MIKDIFTVVGLSVFMVVLLTGAAHICSFFY